jgi:hypothetical protein
VQPGPREDLNQCNQALGSSGKRAGIRRPNTSDGAHRRRGGTGQKGPGARGNLAGGAVKVGVDRRGWNSDDPRRRL